MNSAWDHLAVGFPHSEIVGSKPARGSPTLIAACYVLHRLSVPRHPRNALMTLDRFLRRDKPNKETCIQRMCVSRPAVPFRPKPKPICGQIRKNLFTMTKSLAALQRQRLRQCRRQGSFHFSSNERRSIHQPATRWWSQSGSNRRPQACKASALPTELWPRFDGKSGGPGRI